MPLICSIAVADVATAAGKLATDDAVITDPEILTGDIESLLTSITTLQAVLIHRLRAARDTDATSDLYGRGARRWLVEDQRLSEAEAARLNRLATHLPTYPATQTALDDTRITPAHAAAILTALQSLPIGLRETVEPHLIDRATTHPPEEIAGFADALLDSLGLDTASAIRRERRHTQRGVDLAATFAGTHCLTGTLTPEVGERLDAALTHAAAPTGPGDDRTPRQRRHDALGEIADAYLTHQQPTFTGAPRTVIVTLDLATLENRLRQRSLTLPSGATISADTARRLACDAAIIPAVLGGTSDVLDLGHAGHEFTTPIRRAAYLRDSGRCAYPNCRGRVTELHHLTFRRYGGANSLDNAAWLCTYHHWLAHDGGWTLRRADHGGYHWTSPTGREVERHLDRHT